jgi:hypothetical protein
MHRELLAHTPLLALPIFAMFVFIAVFVAVCAVTLTRRRRAYDAVAQLAVEEEGHE